MINIGVPSKGRLRKDSLNLFIKKKLKIISRQGKRDLFANIKNLNDVRIVYLHAREIIERLSENSLDIGISGYDLLMEAGVNYQKKIYLKKKLNFGKAQLVIAIPNKWIDVQTIADLEEVAFIYRDKYKRNLRVATKYPNLTTKALFLKGVTQFRLVKSLGATEIYPFTGSSEIISDITSSGKTLKANNLRVLSDGKILNSEACLMISKKSIKKDGLKKIINLLSK
tara:strand:- start:3631 stop:4308 length:678 start_codon:yes stop_codon:yes gene_type:complete